MSSLDVVVVAYRSREVIADVVHRASHVPDVASVTVVDNGTDGSADLAEAAGATIIRRPDNPGFGASQNVGAAVGSAPFLLLLNPDAVPNPDGIARGLRHLGAHDDVAAIQGVIVNGLTGEPERSQGVELGPLHLFGRAIGARRLGRVRLAQRIATRTVLRDHVERQVHEPTDVDTLAATAVLVRRAAFEQVGGFDEHYFLYGEDLDLCRRLRRQGWRLVAIPEAFARHESGASSSNSWERELHWWEGTMQFAAQWWSTPRWIAAVGASLVRWVGLSVLHPSGAAEAWTSVVRSGFNREQQTR